MTRKIPRGFTLVELLVVVSIIALLIAILLPSLKKAREGANVVKCLANIRSMQLGIAYYSDDHSQTLPGPLHPPIYRNTARDNGVWDTFDENTQRPWFLLTRIGPYLSRNDQRLEFIDEISTCPTMGRVWPDENFRPGVLAPESKSGEFNPDHSHPYHYLVNSWGTTGPSFYFGWANIGTTWTGWLNTLRMNGTADDPLATGSNSARRPIKIDKIKKASDEWSVGEAWWDKRITRPNPLAPPTTTMLGTWQSDGGNSHYPLPRKPIHSGRKATDMVYFDGHAGTYRGSVDDWIQFFPANRNPEHPLFTGN